MTHKYSQGAYTVILFDKRARKVGTLNARSVTEASDLGAAHELVNGGSYVITRTITNSASRGDYWMPTTPSAAALAIIAGLGLSGCSTPDHYIRVLTTEVNVQCCYPATCHNPSGARPESSGSPANQ